MWDKQYKSAGGTVHRQTDSLSEAVVQVISCMKGQLQKNWLFSVRNARSMLVSYVLQLKTKQSDIYQVRTTTSTTLQIFTDQFICIGGQKNHEMHENK